MQFGLTLIELLVVLAILAGMLGLLLPAVQQAREAGRSTVCLNNLRQLGIAAQSHRELAKVFPVPHESWTVTLLPWMEERPLADELKSGNWQIAIGKRPPIFRCPSQADPPANDTGIRTCHYTLVLRTHRKGGSVRLSYGAILDRQRDFANEEIKPWYIGPTDEGTNLDEGRGPHRGRYNST